MRVGVVAVHKCPINREAQVDFGEATVRIAGKETRAAIIEVLKGRERRPAKEFLCPSLRHTTRTIPLTAHERWPKTVRGVSAPTNTTIGANSLRTLDQGNRQRRFRTPPPKVSYFSHAPPRQRGSNTADQAYCRAVQNRGSSEISVGQ